MAQTYESEAIGTEFEQKLKLLGCNKHKLGCNGVIRVRKWRRPFMCARRGVRLKARYFLKQLMELGRIFWARDAQFPYDFCVAFGFAHLGPVQWQGLPPETCSQTMKAGNVNQSNKPAQNTYIFNIRNSGPFSAHQNGSSTGAVYVSSS